MNEGIVVFDATTRPWKRYWFPVSRAVVFHAIDTAKPPGKALSVILPHVPELTSRDTVWEFFDDPDKAAAWNPEAESRGDQVMNLPSFDQIDREPRVSGGQTTVADLFRSRNVLVRNVLVAWQHGNFPNLESALIFLAVHLAHDNERLMERAVIEIQKTSPLVPKV